MKKDFPKLNASDFVSYLIREYGVTSPLRIQKLLYFIFKDFYKSHNLILFEENFEAWINGPVVPEVYFSYRNYFLNQEEQEFINTFECIEDFLESKQLKMIDEVISKYVKYATYELVEMSHNEKAWILARKRSGIVNPLDQTPSNEKLKLFDIGNY